MNKNKSWDFVLRGDQELKKEIEKLSIYYNCSIQEMLAYIIRVGLMNLQMKDYYYHLCDMKKFLETNENIKE